MAYHRGQTSALLFVLYITQLHDDVAKHARESLYISMPMTVRCRLRFDANATFN